MQTGQSSIASSINGILFSPKSTFVNIKQQPRLMHFIFLLLSVNLIFFLATLRKLKEAYVFTLAGREDFSVEAAKSKAIYEVISQSLLAPPLVWLILTGLIMLISLFFGYEGKFRSIMTLVIFAWVPALLKNIVKSLLIVITPASEIKYIETSMALFLPREQFGSAFYIFFSKLDFFTIWTLVLVSVAAGIFYKTDTKQWAIPIFTGWAASIIVLSLIAAQLSSKGVI